METYCLTFAFLLCFLPIAFALDVNFCKEISYHEVQCTVPFRVSCMGMFGSQVFIRSFWNHHSQLIASKQWRMTTAGQGLTIFSSEYARNPGHYSFDFVVRNVTMTTVEVMKLTGYCSSRFCSVTFLAYHHIGHMNTHSNDRSPHPLPGPSKSKSNLSTLLWTSVKTITDSGQPSNVHINAMTDRGVSPTPHGKMTTISVSSPSALANAVTKSKSIPSSSAHVDMITKSRPSTTTHSKSITTSSLLATTQVNIITKPTSLTTMYAKRRTKFSRTSTAHVNIITPTAHGSTKFESEVSNGTCRCHQCRPPRAINWSALNSSLEALRSELLLDRSNLSSNLRRKSCAYDKRTASVAMGYVGTAAICTVFILFVFVDVLTLCGI